MKHILIILAAFCHFALANAQRLLQKVLRRATFYAAVNGGNSVSDQDVYSVSSGPLTTRGVIETPFDYSLTLGVRKIAQIWLRKQS